MFFTPSFDLPLDSIVLIGFYLVAGLYTVFTIILYYHWQQYSIDDKVSRLTYIVYLVTTLPLIGLLGILTFFIN